ncbi:hypothetical protein [Pandoraea pnomenusa]|uniref:hypothetical protein n=1 Tax=Pandoraea pnomenusa TaxID=93220 RepID=UPI000AD73319|nr:hypothetical protein [Pandoraea pnomenusa]
MTRNNQDEFLKETRHHLAMRAGFRCSMSGCRALTAGPSNESPDAVVSVGVAAHIHAASPGGRRYDSNMTSDERRNIRNGIWLCATHSVEIDRDEVRYTADVLRQMKAEHERAISSELNTGRGCFHNSDLVAIGPNIVGIGELLGTSGNDWSVRIDYFVEGDVRQLIRFIDQFETHDPFDRYLVVNALGDGRQLARAPSWRRNGSAIELTCTVENQFPRVNANKLGATIATNSANDLFVERGNIAMVSGLDSLPQIIKQTLSMLQGESPFHPKAGSRIKEYFDEFEDTPWLERWVKLEVVRLSCVPYQDRTQGTVYTLLQSILHVHKVEQLTSERTDNWHKFRFSLDVEGVGPWEQVIPIFVPRGDIPPKPPGWEHLAIN